MVRGCNRQRLACPVFIDVPCLIKDEVGQPFFLPAAFAFKSKDNRKYLLLGDLVPKRSRRTAGPSPLTPSSFFFDDIPYLLSTYSQNSLHSHQVRFAYAEMSKHPVSLSFAVSNIDKKSLKVRPHRIQKKLIHCCRADTVQLSAFPAGFRIITFPYMLDH